MVTYSDSPLSSYYRELIEDDERWCSELLSIVDRETANIVPYKPSNFQKYYIEKRKNGPRRRVIVKPRQIFASTQIKASNFKDVVTLPGTRCLIVTHNDDATKIFRQTIRNWCDQLDAVGLLPEKDLDNDGILSFKNLQSFIVFLTAGSKMGARSTSFNRVHLSEVAHWASDPSTLMGSILPSMPQDAHIDMESTPNGVEGPLHDYYVDAKNGENEWEPIFWRWFDNPAYVKEVPDGFVLGAAEEKVMKQYNLSMEQMAWRRWMQAEMRRTRKDQERTMFQQEYPEDDISCFLAGSDLVLSQEALMMLIEMVQPPKINREGWDIWKAPIPNRPYVLGADSSEGKMDYSAAQILDALTLEQVARYHAKTIPSVYAEAINIGARVYNNAHTVVETPGPGERVLDRLMSYFGYDNLFYYVDEITKKAKDEPGWPQNMKTRGILIDTLQTLTMSLGYTVYDERTVRELASLTWRKVGNMRRARAEAAPGAHDDLVFGLGLALCGADDARLHYLKTRNPRATGRRVVSVADQLGSRPPEVYRGWDWDGVIPGDLEQGIERLELQGNRRVVTPFD